MIKVKKFLALCTAFVVAFSTMLEVPVAAAQQEKAVSTEGKADQLIIGNIISMDGKDLIYEAMTVKNGLVQYVGTLSTAKRLCDDKTKVVDYGDNYIYPGFMDAHAHGIMAGPRLQFYVDLSEGKSYEDYAKTLKEYIKENPDNENIYGSGWHFCEKDPDCKILDEVCSDKPISLNSVDGHSLWMNSKAMEVFGVDAAFAKEWGTDMVRVDSKGNPTGYLSEGPTSDILKKMLEFSEKDWEKALLTWQDFAFSKGITGYYEAGGNEQILGVMDKMVKEGKWKLRSFQGILIDEHEEDYVKSVQNAKKLADKYNSEYLKVTGIKIFIDGVIEGHTGWMLDEYDDQPGYYGVKRFCDLDRTVELYKEASKYGFSVHQHTIGDAAVSFTLDCIEKAELETGDMDMRNAMAHLQCVSDRDRKRMGELNVIGVVAPLWSCKEDDGMYEQCEEYIGKERSEKMYPARSLRDNGVTLAFHSDYPVSTKMSFPETIYIACKRKGSDQDDSRVLGAQESLSRKDALAGITTGPAYAVKMEDHLGQLKVGYIANYVVYDNDFLHDDLEKVAASKLIATAIDGEEVYTGE